MAERKDRLIQTRVPETLESTLKQEARRRRTSVSQTIRHILEDTFNLVDGVVANVDDIVTDSVEFAQQVRRSAARIGGAARAGRNPCREPRADAESSLAHVQAWNEVVLNQSVPCSKCGADLPRGCTAYMGLSGDPSAPSAWVCSDAVESLADTPEASDAEREA